MYAVPLGPARAEIRVSNSRFIASLDLVRSVEEARAFIARVKTEFSDATHNVPAFIVGGGKSVTEFCSDDGEPSGTSGKPLLAVLRGSGLGDVAVVVTRYFGGTLLGTGGLVKAYSEAGKAVLALSRKAEQIPQLRLHVDVPYPLHDKLRMAALAEGCTIVEERFAESVLMVLDVAKDDLEKLQLALAERSAGQVRALVIEEKMGLKELG